MGLSSSFPSVALLRLLPVMGVCCAFTISYCYNTHNLLELVTTTEEEFADIEPRKDDSANRLPEIPQYILSFI
jgi:ABC-type proline/glycine betaine transport system permease subunit